VGKGFDNGAISPGGRFKSDAETAAALDHSRELRDHFCIGMKLVMAWHTLFMWRWPVGRGVAAFQLHIHGNAIMFQALWNLGAFLSGACSVCCAC
jgi:hypothetical protein